MIGIVASFFLFFFRHTLYQWTGAHAEFMPTLDEYFIIRLVGFPFGLLYLASLSILRSMNFVRSSFLLVFFSTVFNIIFSALSLNYFSWGTAGVAWATSASMILGALSALWLIYKNTPNLFRLRDHLNWQLVFEFQKDSLHMLGRTGTLTLAFWLGTKTASHIGVTELSAYQILNQIWLFASFFLDGIAVTATILIAQNKSILKILSLRKILKHTLSLGAILGLAFTLIYAAGYNFFPRLFTQDEQVLIVVSGLYPFLLLFLLHSSLAYTFDGILFGFNDFKSLKIHMIIATTCFFVPLCIWAYQSKNLLILWIGLGLLNAYRFASGLYLTRKNLRKLVPLTG